MPEELEAKIREVLAEHPRLNPDRYEREDKEKIISLRDATRTFFVYEFHNPSKKNQPIDLDPYMTWDVFLIYKIFLFYYYKVIY